MMLRETWSRSDSLANELDRCMGHIVTGRDVPCLALIDVYEA